MDLYEAVETICKDYCKYPDIESGNRLADICDKCPMNKCEDLRWADRKTENSSEKPNNCECEPRKEQNFCGKCRYLYRDFKYGLSCYRLMDNEPCKYEDRKTEPTISKMEQVETEPQTFDKPTKCLGCLYSDLDKDFHPCASCENFSKYVGEVSGKDEPQTDCAWK